MIRLNLLRRLAGNTRGTSMVELALLAPFFGLMAMGTVDAARAVSEKIRLQQAATRTMEMASAGGLNGASWNNLQAEAAAASNVELRFVTVDKWLECDRVRQGDFGGSCASDQEVGRYASVAIRQSYAPWFSESLKGLGWQSSGTITLEGRSSVRVH